MNKLLAFLLSSALLVMAGCQSMPQSGAPQVSTEQSALATAQQTVFNLTQAYNGVVSVALVYKRLPTCGSATATQLCSNADVVDRLKKADNIAYNALVAAQDVVRTSGGNMQTVLLTAQKAIEALAAVAATLPKSP